MNFKQRIFLAFLIMIAMFLAVAMIQNFIFLTIILSIAFGGVFIGFLIAEPN